MYNYKETQIYIDISIDISKLATLSEGDPKVPISIASKPKCR